MRAAGLRQNRVGHPAAEIVNPWPGRLAACEQRIVQIRQREHRHPIAIAIQPIQIRILCAASFHEHLDRKGLPGRVRRPPPFVRRRRLRKAFFEIRVRALPDAWIDDEFQIGSDVKHVQQVGRQVGRHCLARARPIGKSTAAALEPFEFLQCLLDRWTHL